MTYNLEWREYEVKVMVLYHPYLKQQLPGRIKEDNKIIWGTRKRHACLPCRLSLRCKSPGKALRVHKHSAPSYVKSLNMGFNYFRYALACRLRKKDDVANPSRPEKHLITITSVECPPS